MTEENVPPGKCYLNHIAVDDGIRGKGIGKILMEKVEKEARARQCKVGAYGGSYHAFFSASFLGL